ncbi:MAG: S41 family peptidase [Huintestinicola sp.]
MEILDIVLIILEIVLSLLLIIPAKLSEKIISTKWRILFAVPAVVCMIIAGFSGFEKLMLPTYIGAAVTLAGFFLANKKVRIASSVICAVLCLITLPMCIDNPAYRARNFTKEFEEIFTVMKNHYVLAEHKSIDWGELYSKYHPMFMEADMEHSFAMSCLAWCRFKCEFHDGHVGYGDEDLNSEEEYDGIMAEIFDIVGAGDYGISLMGLSDGRTCAVNADDTGAVAEAGIHNGTIITLWNGMSIEEAGTTSPLDGLATHFADKDNEAFFLPLRASVNGGDSVTVTYLDDNGVEKTAELPRLGNGYNRYCTTLNTICRGVEAANFGWTEINEDTVCFRLKEMMFDSEAARNDNYDNMKYEVIAALDKYRAEGKKNLVIDMRNNGGGSGKLVKALGEIFAPRGTHFYAADGAWDDMTHSYAHDPETGEFIKGEEHYFIGEDRWEGNPIIILVNSDSASAADHFTMIMSGMENVIVMGFTEANGSAQGIGIAVSGKAKLSFSNCLMLDREGNVFIDSGTDFESGNDIDIRIPFDENAVRVLFDEDGDYVMQMAVEQFDQE